MSFNTVKLVIVAVSTFASLVPAGAASFITRSGFGPVAALGTDGMCKAGASTGEFATGQVIGAGDISGGCTGYYTVNIDTTAKTITLTSVEVGNYESNTLDIVGITGTTITGLSNIHYAPLFDPEFFGDPTSYGAVPSPVTSFTGSSISISFSSLGETPGQFTFGNRGGQAVFAYTSSGTVPEPASWALMILGFGLVGCMIRRRYAAPA